MNVKKADIAAAGLKLAGLLAFAAAIAFSKGARFRDDKGAEADLYVFGKTKKAKAAAVTNRKPAEIAVSAVKGFFADMLRSQCR